MTIKWENLPAGEHDLLIPGKAGIVEAKLNIPEANETSLIPKALAICCHPHPLFGGAMNNKVVTRLAIANATSASAIFLSSSLALLLLTCSP